jgi:hypothetical protein
VPSIKRPPGPTPTSRQRVVAPSTGIPVSGSTDKPEYTSTRVVASYKIDEQVKRDFARYAKRLNRDKEPNEETEIGTLAEQALVEYMHNHPVEG